MQSALLDFRKFPIVGQWYGKVLALLHLEW